MPASLSTAHLTFHRLSPLRTPPKVKWNPINGNWLLSASRDHTIRLFDIRSMKEPVSLQGHRKDVFSLAWHPTHERLFASGSFDGELAFWLVGNNDPQVQDPPHQQQPAH